MTEHILTQEQLRNYVGTQMSRKRFSHTLGVEAEALELAKIFGLSEEDCKRLQIAALLHDLTKEKSKEEQIALCEQYHIPYTPYDVLAPKVFHAKTGAAAAKALFPHLVDEGIYQAIFFHTVGDAEMTLFDSLLYLADYIEAGRTFGDCVRLRAFFYEGIRQGKDKEAHLLDTLLLSFDMTISDLLSSQAVLAPQTVASRNALLLKKHG